MARATRKFGGKTYRLMALDESINKREATSIAKGIRKNEHSSARVTKTKQGHSVWVPR